MIPPRGGDRDWLAIRIGSPHMMWHKRSAVDDEMRYGSKTVIVETDRLILYQSIEDLKVYGWIHFSLVTDENS